MLENETHKSIDSKKWFDFTFIWKQSVENFFVKRILMYFGFKLSKIVDIGLDSWKWSVNLFWYYSNNNVKH